MIISIPFNKYQHKTFKSLTGMNALVSVQEIKAFTFKKPDEFLLYQLTLM